MPNRESKASADSALAANAAVAELTALSCAGLEILMKIFLSTAVRTWSRTIAHQSAKLGSLEIVSV